jgi:RimJ/RimL family protein N-acetyltransferase
MSDTLRLQSERLLLRPLAATDAEAVVRYRTHPAVRRFQSWGTHPEQVREQVLAQAAGPGLPGQWFQLAVLLQDPRVLVGDLGLRLDPTHSDTAELGITIDPAHQRHGIAAEALGLLVQGAERELGLARVQCLTEPDNLPCIALLEKLRFRRVALLVAHREVDERQADDLLYERVLSG